MCVSFSSTCVGIVEKRMGLILHHGAANSVDALQFKRSSVDGEFERAGQKNDWAPRNMHQASESI